MADSSFVIIISVVLIGILWLAVWILRRIARGEIGISANTALLVVLAVILLVPFAMNFSAHLISGMTHNSSLTEDAASQSDHH